MRVTVCCPASSLLLVALRLLRLQSVLLQNLLAATTFSVTLLFLLTSSPNKVPYKLLLAFFFFLALSPRATYINFQVQNKNPISIEELSTKNFSQCSMKYHTTIICITLPCKVQYCCRNRGSGKRQAALGDVEQPGLFSASAGSEDLPPESEHQVFVLGVAFI